MNINNLTLEFMQIRVYPDSLIKLNSILNRDISSDFNEVQGNPKILEYGVIETPIYTNEIYLPYMKLQFFFETTLNHKSVCHVEKVVYLGKDNCLMRKYGLPTSIEYLMYPKRTYINIVDETANDFFSAVDEEIKGVHRNDPIIKELKMFKYNY